MGNSIKQYNKIAYLIRTETTINNPKSLGLQKPVLYLQAWLWYGFKTADLAAALPQFFRNSTQIRYELKKLIVRGIVQKKKNQSFYMVTQLGWKWLWISITSITYFENPIISTIYPKNNTG